MRLGVEGVVLWTRASGERWNAGTAALIGLSGLEFAPDWKLYANFAATRTLDTGKHVNGLRVALSGYGRSPRHWGWMSSPRVPQAVV